MKVCEKTIIGPSKIESEIDPMLIQHSRRIGSFDLVTDGKNVKASFSFSTSDCGVGVLLLY
jgi:hypothetical protein